LTAIALIAYGYVCRLARLYFFWESRMIGWSLFFIAFLLLLIHMQSRNIQNGKLPTGYKIGIGATIFVLAGFTVAYILLPYSDACKAAKSLIGKNPEISRRIGGVRSMILVPYGYGVSMSTTDRGDSEGEAEFSFLLHGNEKDADLEISVAKEWKTDWTILEYSLH
jgi:hypothetical protein